MSFKAGPGASEPLGTAKAFRVADRLQSNSSEVIRSAVNNGMDIGYSPTRLFEEKLVNGTVVRLMSDWESTPSAAEHFINIKLRVES